MHRERIWLRLFGFAVVAGGIALACGGSEFAANDGTGGDAGSGAVSGNAGGGALGGTSGGGTTLCDDAGDCDDGNPCSLDVCNELGICEHPAKCTGTENRCCAGECGQCCGLEDCNDGQDCTTDACFAGFCTNMPDSSLCSDPAAEYCDPGAGCKTRESCPNGTAAECDDGNPCTTDRCDASRLCAHDACENGQICCPGQGCGECCSNSGCGNGGNACRPRVCENRQCTEGELCTLPGTICCNRSNGAADCGVECCSTSDCEDDAFDCTITKCTAQGCVHEPHSEECDAGQTCVAGLGCVGGGGCNGPADCLPSSDACQSVRCTNRVCEYVNACSGAAGSCCPGRGCQECCSDTECQGSSKPLCCPSDGKCGECCTAADCGGNLAEIITPAGPGQSCRAYQCTADHTCVALPTALCRPPMVCCPGVGCSSSCPVAE